MEENTLERRPQYNPVGNMYQRAAHEETPEPRAIIAKGVELSTRITDKAKVAELTDKALQGESVAKNGNYDVFLFGIAESLEKIKCETSSINEYFGWMDEAQHIMDNMTDGFVSPEDLAEKNDFIANSWQREAEILICLGLYERSNNPLAAQRVSEMTMKLRRLRQLRSALVNNTKNKADKEPLTPVEQDRLHALMLTLRNMRRADQNEDYENETVTEELEHLRAAHTKDVEFYSGYSFYTRMLDDQRIADMQRMRVRTRDYVERLEKLHNNQDREESKEDVRAMILRLTGRKLANSEDLKNQRINDYQYSRHQQAFDAERFRRLKALKEQEAEYDY